MEVDIRNVNLVVVFVFSATFKSLKSDVTGITVKVRGGVELEVVFGDIVNETTDVVVNSTDFTNFQGESF